MKTSPGILQFTILRCEYQALVFFSRAEIGDESYDEINGQEEEYDGRNEFGLLTADEVEAQ